MRKYWPNGQHRNTTAYMRSMQQNIGYIIHVKKRLEIFFKRYRR